MAKQINRYYQSNRASKYIYGIILMFVLVLSQSHTSNFSATRLAVLAIFASVSFAFAEIYAEILGSYIKNQGKTKKTERLKIVDDSLSMVSTGAIVAIIFTLSASGLYGQVTAFNIAYFVLLTLLFGFSYWAYRLIGFSALKSIIISVLSALVGLFVIWLKYVFGH